MQPWGKWGRRAKNLLAGVDWRSIVHYIKGMGVQFQTTIKRELARRGWSGYRLGHEARMPVRTIQAYLSGDRDLTGKRLAKVLDTLDLELRPKQQRRRKG